nr:hypothetical protein [Tanacetum cinerariifolium]
MLECKEAIYVAISSAEAEYVVAAGCCAQVLWIKSQLVDYDVLYDKVKFQHHKSIIAYKNAVALLEQHEHLFKPMLSFLSKCSICTTLTKEPLAMYVKYLKDFWYTAEVDDATKDISFSLSLFGNQLSFTRFDFLIAIGITDSKTDVSHPPKGTVRAGLATLGLADKDKPSLTSTELTPSASEFSLTSHMLKVAKLSKEPDESLILSSEEETEELMDTAVPIQSLEASVMAKVQDNQLKAVDTTEVLEKTFEKEEIAEEQTLEIPSLKQLLEEVDNHNQVVQTTSESPYDTESEIKVVKSFLTNHLSELHYQTMNDYKVSADIQDNSDSDLHSMPDDELRPVLEFKTANSDDFHDNDVSTSDYIVKDDYALAERLSLPDHMDHICEKPLSPTLSKSSYLEFSQPLSRIVFQTRIPAASEQFAETQTQLNKKVVKQINRQFNISHVAQSNRFVTLQKELSKVIKSEVAKKVQVVGLEGDTNAIPDPTQMEQKTADNITPLEPSPKTQGELAYKESTLPVSETKVNKESVMVLYESEKNDLVDLTTEQDSKDDDDDLDKQPLEPNSPRDESNEKGIAAEEPPKDIMPFMEEGGSVFKMLAELKEQEKKSEDELKKLLNPATFKAQALKWEEHEEKKAKMRKEFNKCISERTDPLPITKISYVVNSSKTATMRITRDKDPLNLGVYSDFRLRMLGFSEWLEVHAGLWKNL